VVSVSSTTRESLMETCERIMADPNLLAGDRRGGGRIVVRGW
jgi:hypothetical protein